MPEPRNESGWTGAELDLIEANPDLDSRSLAALLPGRTSQAVGNVRSSHFGHRPGIQYEKPAVKAPGQYVEILASLFVREWDLMDIWCRWNGYSSYQVLHTTRQGWSTILCEAKLWNRGIWCRNAGRFARWSGYGIRNTTGRAWLCRGSRASGRTQVHRDRSRRVLFRNSSYPADEHRSGSG